MSLVAQSASRSFGGVKALDQVDLRMEAGEIHGLIGPNGSGKTTLLNLFSGYYQPDGGHIRLDDTELTGQPVQRRAFCGIARTFQKPRLLPSLSVLDNVMLGGWPQVRSGFMATALSWISARREERVLRDRARELVAAVGLGHALTRRANLLEHAEQRFLEIARALMTQPRFILLDEPAGGLTPGEIDALGTIVRTLSEAGIGVLLVEHHTDFVFRLSHRVTALDLGRVIRQGTPDEVRNDPEVIRVYLGA